MGRRRLTPLGVVLVVLLVGVVVLALLAPAVGVIAAVGLAFVALVAVLDRAPSRAVDRFALRGNHDVFAAEAAPGELAGPHRGPREPSASTTPPSQEVDDEAWRRERERR